MTDLVSNIIKFNAQTNGRDKVCRFVSFCIYLKVCCGAIPTRLLQDFASELSPVLTLLFRASVSQATVPDDWKQALVAPIFKKGDKSSPANYRPITLTSVCCKIMEHIMHSQIMQHLDEHGILSDAQHWFRKHRSCETQLLLTLQDLSAALDNSEQIDAILLDFSKAFDKVPY